MPMDKTRYPADWKQISFAIRQRANWHCDWCGVRHGEVGLRLADGRFIPEEEIPIAHDIGLITHDQAAYQPTIAIVLTVAHLGTPHPDGTPGDKHNKMDCRPENLAALCQRCHLRYDRDEHAVNSRMTRLRKKASVAADRGQQELTL